MKGDSNMNFRLFLAQLILYAMNIKDLHWLAHGDEFDAVHNGLTNDYHEKLCEDVDYIAEALMRNGEEPLNLPEVHELIASANRKFIVVHTDRYYNKEEVYNICQKMLEDIKLSIEYLIKTIEGDIKQVGIKSTLEGMHEWYDLQVRFLNHRRIV